MINTHFLHHFINFISAEAAMLHTTLPGVRNRPLADGMLPFLWDTGSIINRSSCAVQDQRLFVALVQGTQTGASPTFQIGGSSIYLINRTLEGKKNGARSTKIDLPHEGSNAIRISNKFVADLKRIADLDIRMKEYDSFHVISEFI